MKIFIVFFLNYVTKYWFLIHIIYLQITGLSVKSAYIPVTKFIIEGGEGNHLSVMHVIFLSMGTLQVANKNKL